jgi:hypothetical protein
MLTPRFNSNFASSARNVDESSVQSGLAHSYPALDALQKSHLAFHYRRRLRMAIFNSILHRPAGRELRFQFPTGLPTGLESRPIRAVDSSAKHDETCGFHQLWCMNRRAELQFNRNRRKSSVKRSCGLFQSSLRMSSSQPVEHFWELCGPEFCRCPTHSAEKRGMDGAWKSSANPKKL